jgi:hypothetical protein
MCEIASIHFLYYWRGCYNCEKFQAEAQCLFTSCTVPATQHPNLSRAMQRDLIPVARVDVYRETRKVHGMNSIRLILEDSINILVQVLSV